MTVVAQGVDSQAPGRPTAPQAIPAPDRPWLAAVAVVPILATVYQTLVLTDVIDDQAGVDAKRFHDL